MTHVFLMCFLYLNSACFFEVYIFIIYLFVVGHIKDITGKETHLDITLRLACDFLVLISYVPI